ncbi:hypothetical protein PDN24_19780 [Bacillus cereus]|nr:hypothetical protein [Bacillus cereus]MDA2078376.1 hypothetical protein [Bacillus cereus]MDA2084090.1 hypothetical protein [Bacillus cereus]
MYLRKCFHCADFTGANSITAGNLFFGEDTTALCIHAASAVYSVFIITEI